MTSRYISPREESGRCGYCHMTDPEELGHVHGCPITWGEVAEYTRGHKEGRTGQENRQPGNPFYNLGWVMGRMSPKGGRKERTTAQVMTVIGRCTLAPLDCQPWEAYPGQDKVNGEGWEARVPIEHGFEWDRPTTPMITEWYLRPIPIAPLGMSATDWALVRQGTRSGPLLPNDERAREAAQEPKPPLLEITPEGGVLWSDRAMGKSPAPQGTERVRGTLGGRALEMVLDKGGFKMGHEALERAAWRDEAPEPGPMYDLDHPCARGDHDYYTPPGIDALGRECRTCKAQEPDPRVVAQRVRQIEEVPISIMDRARAQHSAKRGE